jgi:hypothetical protein
MPLPRAPEPPRRALLLFAAVLAIYSAVYAARGVHDPGSADGFYAFLYARSLAFDQDLDFKNDYAICGDPWKQGIDRGTGHVDNPSYPGPALFWTPLLIVARAVVHVPQDAPANVRAGCIGPLARFALASSMVLGALAIVLAYLAARRYARAGPAMAAALLFALASSLPQYASVFVSSSHVHECFAAALLLWLSVRATEEEELGRWGLVGLALGLCALQRLSDVCLVFVPVALIMSEPGPRPFKLRAVGLIAVGGGAGVLAMLGLYAYLYASPFALPQGRHYMHLDHAHPWLLLFAPHGGLFFTTPVAYLGVVGIGVGLATRRYRLFAAGAAVSFIVCLWVSSAPLDWNAKATFGARRLVVLTPLFVLFGAMALESGAPFLRRHRGRLLAFAALVIFGTPVLGGVLGTTTGETSLEGNTQAGTYGGGVASLFAVVDERLGDVTILPAEAFYALRFGVPMRSFRAATTDRRYQRSYRDLSWEPNALDFREAPLREASAGARPHERGVELTSTNATFVFLAGWPFATNASLELDADGPTTIALRLGTTFGRCDLGEHRIEGGHATLAFEIPPGCFDSGLIELRFHTDRESGIVLERLVLEDKHTYPPPY